MTHISIEDIDPKLLLEKGILTEKIDSKVVALSKVLDSLHSCSYGDAVWALEHTLQLLQGEVTPPQDWAEMVIMITAQTFGFQVIDLKNKGRSPELSLARQIAMYILWRADKYTLNHIGHLLGDRTPATISHGFQAVITRMKSETWLREAVDELQDKLE